MSGFTLKAFRSTPLPTEEQIMQGWQGDASNPAVSVVCITYNQERYIHDTLRGLLIQRTAFPFEIIIHDDASTDSTRGIVQDYAQRYPHIIKAILQTENQYSKSPNSVIVFPLQKACGKYIAFCEGDDFWTDSSKLQIQHDALEDRPDIHLCAHRSLEILGNDEQDIHLQKLIDGNRKRHLSLGFVIQKGCGMMNTASLLIRRSAIANLPDWFLQCPVADVFLKAIAAQPNGALYLPNVMCVYRVGAVGSWSEGLYKKYEKFLYGQEAGLRHLEGIMPQHEKKHIKKVRGRLALSGSSFYFDNKNRKKCKELAWESVKLSGKLKKRAIRNLFFASNPVVFRMVRRLRGDAL